MPTAEPSSPRFETERVAAEVAALGTITDATGRLLGRPTTCLGRDDEIDALVAELDACLRGESRAAVITGPPGVGKSRVLLELLDCGRALAEDALLLFARGDPMAVGAPLGLLARVLRREAGILNGEPPKDSREKLKARVSRHVPREDVPRVAELLGVVAKIPRDEDASFELAAETDARVKGDQMRRAWEDFLAAECAAHPVILVLEDFHWGDLPTATFVDSALRVLDRSRFFVVAAARPEVHYLFPQLWSRRRTRHVSLEALPRSACLRLVRAALGADVPASEVLEIVERGAGNPLHLEEIVRAFAAGSGRPPGATLLTMVRSRLEAQEADARKALRAASVFGQVFWLGGVVALAGGAPQVRAVTVALSDLEGRELVARRPAARFPYETELIFRHALIQEAAYASLTEDDRADAHRIAGDWLERMGESEAMVLAEHFERGRSSAQAAHWYRVAAWHALEGNDLGAAVERADRAIACGISGEALGELRALQAEAHQWRGSASDALHCALEAMAVFPKGSPEWFKPAGQAARASHVLGDRDHLVEIAEVMMASWPKEGVSPLVVSAGVLTCVQLHFAGLHDMGDLFFSRIESYAGTSRDPAILARLAQVRAVRGLFGRSAGDLPELFERAVVGFEAIGDLRNAFNWRANLGFALVEVGAYAEAERVLREGLERATRLGLDNTVATHKHNLGLALARLGNLDEGCAVEEEALAHYAATGDRRLESASRIYLALILEAKGDHLAAADEAQRAVAAFPGVAPVRAHALAALAHVELTRGHAYEALAASREAMALLEALGRLEGGEALLRLVHAEALFATGNTIEARAAIVTAHDHLQDRAERMKNPAWRKGFMERVPENARTLELARAWGLT